MEEESDKPGTKEKLSKDTTIGSSGHARESTRSYIAVGYLVAFFGIIVFAFIIGLCNNFKVADYKDILLAVSGVLSGPLGFIIGFYFKVSKED
jgi:hypothetical protein